MTDSARSFGSTYSRPLTPNELHKLVHATGVLVDETDAEYMHLEARGYVRRYYSFHPDHYPHGRPRNLAGLKEAWTLTERGAYHCQRLYDSAGRGI